MSTKEEVLPALTLLLDITIFPDLSDLHIHRTILRGDEVRHPPMVRLADVLCDVLWKRRNSGLFVVDLHIESWRGFTPDDLEEMKRAVAGDVYTY